MTEVWAGCPKLWHAILLYETPGKLRNVVIMRHKDILDLVESRVVFNTCMTIVY